jgi:MFS family permease
MINTEPVCPMVDEREKKIILLVASLSSFLVPFTGSSITVALPAMASHFHADAVTLGWITSAYIISAAVFIVPFGRYADNGSSWPAFSSSLLPHSCVHSPPLRRS